MFIETKAVKAGDAAKPPLDLVFLDFETFYTDAYSLRKMTPPQYVMDHCFEALGMSYAINGADPQWVDGPDLPALFTSWAGKKLVGISHNALFDFSVLRWRYGWLPYQIGDTIGMARAHWSHLTKSLKLADLATLKGLPAKGSTIEKLKGVTFRMLTDDWPLYRETQEYANHDCWLCRELYHLMLAEGFPQDQLELIDMQVRMAVEPKFLLNELLASEHLAQVQAEKAQLLASCGLESRDALMSNDKLAVMLRERGVEPPMKESRTTGQMIYAFARTDKEFEALEDHPDVGMLVTARLGHKTTIEETRTERFLGVARATGGPMPVALKWSGAHTGRLSGDWSMNMQNLKRGGKLRYALEAPEGFLVVSADASQIEARIVATIAGQEDLMKGFAAGEDVYASFASELFHYPVSKKTHPKERFMGKTAILSLGYGSWWQTFANMCRVQSEGKVILDDEEAEAVVKFYRSKFPKIRSTWLDLNNFVEDVEHGPKGQPWRYFGPKLKFANQGAALDNVLAEYEPRERTVRVGKGVIYLPGSEPNTYGPRLNYHDIISENKPVIKRNELGEETERYEKVQWRYQYGNRSKYLYGAKTLENITQALAFIQIMEAARRIKHEAHRRWGYALLPSHQVHDELIYIVPARYAEDVKALACEEIARKPWWLPKAPLAAEGGIGKSYGAAKEE